MSVNSRATVPTGGVEASVTAQAYARGGVHIYANEVGEAFAAYARGLPGRLVIAVSSSEGGDPLVLGADRPFHAWSTIKVPVLVALLTVVHRQALTPEHRELARRAITESDNPAVLELFVLLEQLAGGSSQAAGVIERLFRLAGDKRTVVALAAPPPGAVTPFGQTEWSAADSARFFSALAAGALLNPAATGYVLGLMEQVIAGQRWGLGAIDLGARAAFKGGWGPETDGTCLVRQSGVVGRAPGASAARSAITAISLVAEPPPGEDSFEIGVRIVTDAAAWIAGAIGLAA